MLIKTEIGVLGVEGKVKSRKKKGKVCIKNLLFSGDKEKRHIVTLCYFPIKIYKWCIVIRDNLETTS
jgi:hypothetical protein